MIPVLEARDILVKRGDREVLAVSSLSVHKGESLVVIGPNGAGKSTLLLTLAQLLRPEKGSLIFNGRTLDGKKTLAFRRSIGLVFQDPLLLNSSVAENVAIGLRFRKVSRGEVDERVNYWLERFNVLHLRKRSARQLSGGEGQRVNLARAFSLNPEILLLDEPFSSLDSPTRKSLTADFQTLIAETKQTTLFITHDLDEARSMGDRMAVLLGGKIRQIDSPESVFAAPVDRDVAAFVGLETTVSGSVIKSEDGRITVQVGSEHVEAVGDIEKGRDVFFCLRPEDVTLWSGDDLPQTSARNQVRGSVASMRRQGPLIHVMLDCGFPVGALITQASGREMDIHEGTPLTATFKASAVHLIPR